VPGVVPEFVVELPPQPTKLPTTVHNRTTPNTDIDLRRLLDIPTNVAKRRSATVPNPFHSLGPRSLGQIIALLLAPVVVIFTVTVAVAVLALSVAGPLLEQLGGSTAPLGLEVTAQVKVMVPA
jgi:hypothetical protein